MASNWLYIAHQPSKLTTWNLRPTKKNSRIRIKLGVLIHVVREWVEKWTKSTGFIAYISMKKKIKMNVNSIGMRKLKCSSAKSSIIDSISDSKQLIDDCRDRRVVVYFFYFSLPYLYAVFPWLLMLYEWFVIDLIAFTVFMFDVFFPSVRWEKSKQCNNLYAMHGKQCATSVFIITHPLTLWHSPSGSNERVRERKRKRTGEGRERE